MLMNRRTAILKVLFLSALGFVTFANTVIAESNSSMHYFTTEFVSQEARLVIVEKESKETTPEEKSDEPKEESSVIKNPAPVTDSSEITETRPSEGDSSENQLESDSSAENQTENKDSSVDDEGNKQVSSPTTSQLTVPKLN